MRQRKQVNMLSFSYQLITGITLFLRTHEPCVPTAQVEARRMGLLSVDCCQLSLINNTDYFL